MIAAGDPPASVNDYTYIGMQAEASAYGAPAYLQVCRRSVCIWSVCIPIYADGIRIALPAYLYIYANTQTQRRPRTQ